jgi:hypothetical protein
LQVWPSTGELAARSDAMVTVDFSAMEKKELSEVIALEVRLKAQYRCRYDSSHTFTAPCPCFDGVCRIL